MQVKKDKLTILDKYLSQLGKVAIAYSGGIDSLFLLNRAEEVLGSDNVLAIIAHSVLFDPYEFEEAISYLKNNKVNYDVVTFSPLDDEEISTNSKNRCYKCKRMMMNKIVARAKLNQIPYVLDGQNYDDSLSQNRPGMRAVKELYILSPLMELGFRKKEIIELAKDLGRNLVIITREDIKKVEDDFIGSEFVKNQIGVGCVSEPCALLASNGNGNFLEQKYVYNGITISIYEEKFGDE